jgi:hypothetical protein
MRPPQGREVKGFTVATSPDLVELAGSDPSCVEVYANSEPGVALLRLMFEGALVVRAGSRPFAVVTVNDLADVVRRAQLADLTLEDRRKQSQGG